MHSLFNMINGNERQSRSNDIKISTIQSEQASEILEKPSENPLSEPMNDSVHNIECNKDNLEKGSRKEITIKEFVQNNVENRLSNLLSSLYGEKSQKKKERMQVDRHKILDSKEKENSIIFIDFDNIRLEESEKRIEKEISINFIDNDNISTEESEKRIINYCLFIAALMILVIFSMFVSFPILLLEHKPIIIQPKIVNEMFCKYN